MPHPVLTAAARFRQQLINRERQAEQRMVQAYGRAYQRLLPQIRALEETVEGLDAPSREQVMRLGSMRALRQGIETEIGRYAIVADQEIANLTGNAIQLGLNGSRATVEAYFDPDFLREQGLRRLAQSGQGQQALRAAWNQLAPEQAETMVGFLAEDSPLHSNLVDRLGPTVAQRFADKLATAIVLGINPRQIAREARTELGVGLTWSVVAARTGQIWAYREASRANYMANSDVIGGWTWHATLDSRTCFPAGTLVTTESGDVPIEKLSVGDKVLTHTGQYKRVTETMRRKYNGCLVEIVAGNLRVTCTPEHPLLIERQGHLDWVEAADVLLSDSVVCQMKGRANQVNHAIGNVTVKSGVGNSDDSISPRLQPESFSGIALADGFTTMPICAINFKHSVDGGHEKINRVSPSRESMLLNVLDTYSLKGQASVPLWTSFAGMSPVATKTAKRLIVGRNRPEFLVASGASFDNGRAAALLGAMSPYLIFDGIEKNRATTLTSYINRLFPLAIERAEIISVGIASCYDEMFTATNADFFNLLRRNFALFGAILSLYCRRWRLELLVACRAFSDNTWFCWRAESPMRRLLLVFGVTENATEFSAAAFNTSRRNHEFGVTYGANSFDRHKHIVSHPSNHSQVEGMVYNIEVEDEHSYVAGGLVVHNCMSCVAKHGERFPVDAVLEDHHSGRCVAIPELRLAARFGLDLPEIEPGEQWFSKQPEATQKTMMGPAMFDAWKAREFVFGDLSQRYVDPVYGEMLREASLKALLGQKAQEFYVR